MVVDVVVVVCGDVDGVATVAVSAVVAVAATTVVVAIV